MSHSFFAALLKKLNSKYATDNDLVKCLKLISSLMQFRIAWQNCENTDDINVGNIKQYEQNLGVMLLATPILSFEEMNDSRQPILFQLRESDHIFVFIRKKYFRYKIYNSSNDNYEYHRFGTHTVISKAWICCPTGLTFYSSYFKLLRSSITTFRKQILISMSIGISVAFMALLTTIISGYVLSHIHEVGQAAHFIVYVTFIFLLLCAAFLSYANEQYLNSLNIKALFYILPALWSHISHLPANTSKKILSGDFVQRISDYEMAILLILKASMSVVFGIAAIIVLLCYMAYCNVWVAICYLCICVVFLFIKMLLLPINLKYIANQMAEQGRITSFLAEILMQIYKIRAANVFENVFIKWLEKLIHLKLHAEKSVKLDIISGTIESIVPLLLLLVVYIVLYFSPNSSDHYLLLQLIICAGQFSSLFDKMSSDMLSIIHLIPGIKRLEPIINEKMEFYSSKKNNIILNGDIAFSHIDKRNMETGNLILNDVSFTIERGSFVAFVGRSGAGKSTVFKLLLGLDSACSGEIRIDGEDINTLDMRCLRRQLGVVLQTTNLLPGTIFSNLSATANITSDEAWKLARCVGLEQEIDSMPMKMYTHISDNASESISGGQRQKIILARALAAKPKILLLDEATSALDNRGQEHIHSYLQTLDITRIVIAHRLSTIVNADKIYVLDKGRIIDSGTYHQLMKNDLFLS